MMETPQNACPACHRSSSRSISSRGAGSSARGAEPDRDGRSGAAVDAGDADAGDADTGDDDACDAEEVGAATVREGGSGDPELELSAPGE